MFNRVEIIIRAYLPGSDGRDDDMVYQNQRLISTEWVEDEFGYAASHFQDIYAEMVHALKDQR